MYVPYDDMVHIARDVIASDVWGSDNVPIKQIIELINTTYQGMDRAIRLSGVAPVPWRIYNKDVS